MRRGTIVLLLFILVVAIIIGTSQFLQSQPPTTLRIAVSPLIEDWAQAAIDAYNATNPIVNTHRIRFVVEPVEDTSVWLDDGTARREWTSGSHPAAWIPAWSTSVNYARERMPFEFVVPSLGRTLLVWGGFRSRVDALTDGGVAFDWDRIAGAAAQGSWGVINPNAGFSGNFTLAFNRPNQTMSGFAVLLSGAAAYRSTADLTSSDLASPDYRTWMQPVLESVPNFNTLGASPAETIAARGETVGELALVPESEWLKNLRGRLINSDDPVVLSYPAFPFVFDFPLAVWAEPTTPATPPPISAADTQTAVGALANWLLAPAQQARLADFGLRPPQGARAETLPAEDAALFVTGANYGAQLLPDMTTPIQAPSRSDLQRLLSWANAYIR